MGRHTAITTGADGLGLISYYDATNGDLKVAHCSDAVCTTATLTTLDSAGSVGQYSSIATGPTASASSATTTPPTATSRWPTAPTRLYERHPHHPPHRGQCGSIHLHNHGADGLGLISYAGSGFLALKVAHCSNSACTAATLTTLRLSSVPSYYTSITTGGDGLGVDHL